MIQESALEMLIVMEGQRDQDARYQAALCAAVAGGKADPQRVWPEYFGDPNAVNIPSTGSDMSGFEWEHPTESSFERDLAAMRAAASSFIVPEEPQDEPPQPAGPPRQVTSLEWT